MRIDLSHTNDEEYLVKCCENNDPRAQQILYNIYVEDMMILCLRYVVSVEDAKEVLMDGFLGFFNNIGSFSYRGKGSVKAWLKRIMINKCLVHLRKYKRMIIVGNDIAWYEDKEADEQVLANLTAKEIMKLLHSLPDGYRLVFNLYIFEGLNHREIAAMLGITEGTSKSQLHRAKEMMKEKIIMSN